MNAGNHLVGGGNHSDSFGFFAIIVVVIFIVSITIIVFVIVFVFVIFNIMNGGSQSDSFGFRVDSPPSAQSVFSSSTIISTKTLEKSYKYVFDKDKYVFDKDKYVFDKDIAWRNHTNMFLTSLMISRNVQMVKYI